jgi:hypothetical protein
VINAEVVVHARRVMQSEEEMKCRKKKRSQN